jgi:hypothetical protein
MDTADHPLTFTAGGDLQRLEERFQHAVTRAAGDSLSTYLVELREATQQLADSLRGAGRSTEETRTGLIALAAGAATTEHVRRQLPTVLALVAYWAEQPR